MDDTRFDRENKFEVTHAFLLTKTQNHKARISAWFVRTLLETHSSTPAEGQMYDSIQQAENCAPSTHTSSTWRSRTAPARPVHKLLSHIASSQSYIYTLHVKKWQNLFLETDKFFLCSWQISIYMDIVQRLPAQDLYKMSSPDTLPSPPPGFQEEPLLNTEWRGTSTVLQSYTFQTRIVSEVHRNY